MKIIMISAFLAALAFASAPALVSSQDPIIPRLELSASSQDPIILRRGRAALEVFDTKGDLIDLGLGKVVETMSQTITTQIQTGR